MYIKLKMNNSIEHKQNNSLEGNEDNHYRPHLSESILKIKQTISAKEKNNNIQAERIKKHATIKSLNNNNRDENFKKHINAFASKKNMTFTNKSIFGVNFLPNKESIYCALGYLILNSVINSDGSINIKKYKIITKAHLWSYIYYLRLNNKKHPYFLQNLGEGNKISPLKFYSMVESNKKSVTKKNLVDFLKKLLSTNYKITIPFLQAEKHIIPLLNAYNNNNSNKNSNNSSNNINNTDDMVNIKIIPSVKLVGNTNSNLKYNANSKNSNIKVTLDFNVAKKNSNNSPKNANNNINNPPKNVNNNINKRPQMNYTNVPKNVPKW